MIGKELQVFESQMSFGGKPRMVNVFSLFRYKKSNNIYVVYADVGATVSVVYFGSSHIKGNSILCMSPKEEDYEYVKEFIFKIVNKEKLDGFETLSLDKIDSMEIIAFGHMEIKSDIFNSLVSLTIPKKQDPVKVEEPVKKESSGSLLKFLIFLIIVGGGAYGVYYYTDWFKPKVSIVKTVSCMKTYSHDTLDAVVEDSRVYNFGTGDMLNNVDVTTVFKFNSKESYEDFTFRGLMYKYMPDKDAVGGTKSDDDNNTYTFIYSLEVTDKYTGPVGYEDVISVSKDDGYQCEEKLLEG